jgi:hypothetical protein
MIWAYTTVGKPPLMINTPTLHYMYINVYKRKTSTQAWKGGRGRHGSWIYNYLCNQCLSPLMLWVWIPLRQGALDTTLCDKVCQWHSAGQWFSQGTPVSFTNKTDSHDKTQILLKVAFNTITLTQAWKRTHNLL